MLRSVKDFVDAVDEGRIHTQRFFKNQSGVLSIFGWTDWAYASGQPAYDARIGPAAAFTPVVAVKNDAIWFPGIPANMERRILEVKMMTTPGGTNQLTHDSMIYDLVGYYPLLDGDSTDIQLLDNTLTLPRYESGAEIFPVLVNHVAPAISACTIAVEYTNSDGVAGRTVTWATSLNGLTKACFTSAAGGNQGSLVCGLAPGDKGVRSIDSVQFLTPPGGLFAIYMVKLLGSVPSRSGLINVGVASEKNFLIQNNFHAPRVRDGAALGFFFNLGGSTAQTFAVYGDMTFVWG